MILREEKGWTYGAYSSQTRPVDIGRFEGSAEVRTEVTDSALVELLHQLRRLRTEAVSAEELDGAKGFLLGSFPRQIETPQQIASQVRTVRLLQLDDDYLQTYRERLAAVSGDDIMRVTGRLIRPDSAVIVVVGDGPAVYDALASIAPVRIIDAEGNPLTPEALNPTPEAVVFDHSQIVERRDSFAILVQGNPFGAMTRSIASATVDGRDVLQFTSELSLGPMASQKSMLLVDRATLKPVKLDQTGQQQGQPLEVHIEYGTDGRVTGSASVPEPGGRREVAVDTVLGEYVIDDNMLQALAGALPLSDGNTFTVSAYDATQGSVSRISAKVTDAGVVTVPAGEFPAWKVALSGTEAPLEYWVSKASPRRLVKIALIGQPVSFELVAGGSE